MEANEQAGMTATILSHRIEVFAEKPVVKIMARDDMDGRDIDLLVWLTEKARESGMVGAQLLACGFDLKKNKLSMLEDEPQLLKGRRVGIKYETYNDKLRAAIDIPRTPSKKKMAELDAAFSGDATKKNRLADDPIYGDDIDVPATEVDEFGNPIPDDDIPF